MLEGLENRCLLSSSLNATTGELLVTGTGGNDTLRLARSGQTIVVSDNGNSSSFDAGKVKRVRVNGLDGNDTIALVAFATGQSDVPVRAQVDGGNGNDTVTGGAGDDTLNGNNGNDRLDGRGGNDLLDGGANADVMAGGAGVDTVSYVSRSLGLMVTMDDDAANDGQAGEGDNVKGDVENLLGGSGRDVLIGNALNNTIDGGAGSDTISGRAGNDSLLGGAGDGNDQLFGKEGNDTLRGGSGNDSLVGDVGDDSLDSGIGNDTVTGDSGNDTVWGDEGNDKINGGDGADLLDSGKGNDTVNGDGGDDTVRGGAGNDALSGGDGTDTADYSDHDGSNVGSNKRLQIFLGDDEQTGFFIDDVKVESDLFGADLENFIGSNGQDFVFFNGAEAAARIDGRGGDDLLSGTAFNDTITGGAGVDTVRGNGGDDLLYGTNLSGAAAGAPEFPFFPPAAAPPLPAGDNINGGAGNDLLVGDAGNDTFNGAAGDDTIDAGAGDDNLDGDLGNDSLLGGDGNDTLTGGAGNNIFRGGAGADLMTGNNGSDLFQDLVPQGPAADPTGDQEDGSFFDGGDTVYAGSGSDTVFGSAAGDALYGESGADSILGGDGRDYIDGGDDNDTVDGQGDNDTVIGGFNDDSIMGGDGNDVLSNSDGEADVIDGGDGFDAAQEEAALNDQMTDIEYFYDLNDDPAPSAPAAADPNSVSFNLAPAAPVGPAIDVSANGKNVTVYGSNGNDTITATALSGGRLRVTVDSGANGTATRDIAAGVLRVTVFGNSGNDTIDFTNSLATAGSLIDAGGGNDTVRGGPGPDDIIGGPGPTATESDDDLLSGGTGANVRLEADTLDYAARRRGVFVFLPSSAGEITSGNGQAGESDRIGAGFEQVFGGRSDDRLLGGARADFLSGGRGGDYMEGGRGDDVIIGYVAGETGVDTLVGARGKDSLRSKDDAFMDEYEVDPADFTPQIDKGLDKPYVP